MARRAASTKASGAAWSGARHIAGPADVHRVLAAVNAAGARRATTTPLRRAVEQAGELTRRGRTGHLAVHPGLTPLLPDGLRRGSTVAVVGSTSLMFALVAEAIGQGSYAAVVGAPNLGLAAAAEHAGLDLARLALVPKPGPDWVEVTGVLVDGIDLVVVDPPGAVTAGAARALNARARRHGAVLVPLSSSWPGTDLVLTAREHRWKGLGAGRGRLRDHDLVVDAVGRGAAARRREVILPMPLSAKAESIRQRLPAPAGGLEPTRRSA